MKIVLITAHYQPAAVACGVGDYTRCLRAALEVLGHPCVVLTSSQSQSREQCVYAFANRWGWPDLARALRILGREAPDAILLQYTPEHYGYGLAFKLLPLIVRCTSRTPRILTTFHTLVGGRWVSKPYAALLAATSYGLVSTNAELSDLFRRRLPWFAHKLCEIPIGANIPAPTVTAGAARKTLRERLGLEDETPVLVTFGFPAPGKGYDTLIAALARLPAPPEVHLACCGETRPSDQAYRAELERLAGKHGIAHRVHWMGGLPGQAASDLLAGGDLYVVPYDEGASLRRGTLLAGFRLGLPVVTTLPRYPDPALEDGRTILAVPAQSPEMLGASIRRALGDPALQDRLRRGALELGPRFDWAAIADLHVAFINRLRHGGKAGG